MSSSKPASANAVKKTVLVQIAKTLKPENAPAVSAEIRAALETLLASGDDGLVSAVLPFCARWVKDGSMAKALEPVTKSWSRVPTHRTRSAWAAISAAA